MHTNQHTLKGKYEFEGKGLHTGRKVHMKVEPAPKNFGIQFKRSDLGESAPLVEACVDYVSATSRGTTLDKRGVTVLTLEHLMGALYGMPKDRFWYMRIDNVSSVVITFDGKRFMLDSFGLTPEEVYSRYAMEGGAKEGRRPSHGEECHR